MLRCESLTQTYISGGRELTVLQDIGFEGFVAMMIFLLILVVGFVYEWKKGALEWE